MKSTLISGIKNPLSPFILLMAMIILITIIITNIKTSKAEPETETEQRNVLFDSGLTTGYTKEKESAVPASEPDIRALTASALDDWARGGFANAEDKFRTILIFRPNNAIALSHLGAILHQNGDYRAAEMLFRTQTIYYPNDANAFLNLATVLAKQHKLAEALAASKHSLALSPAGSAATYLSLAKIYALAHNRKGAIDFLRRAEILLGSRLIEACGDSAFDSIRETQEFKALLHFAKGKEGGNIQ